MIFTSTSIDMFFVLSIAPLYFLYFFLSFLFPYFLMSSINPKLHLFYLHSLTSYILFYFRLPSPYFFMEIVQIHYLKFVGALVFEQ